LILRLVSLTLFPFCSVIPVIASNQFDYNHNHIFYTLVCLLVLPKQKKVKLSQKNLSFFEIMIVFLVVITVRVLVKIGTRSPT